MNKNSIGYSLFLLLIIIIPLTIFAVGESIIFKTETFVNNSNGSSKVKIYKKDSPPDEISIKQYIKAVLNGEIGEWAKDQYLEAFKAQAVAARSLLLNRSKLDRIKWYKLCNRHGISG